MKDLTNGAGKELITMVTYFFHVYFYATDVPVENERLLSEETTTSTEPGTDLDVPEPNIYYNFYNIASIFNFYVQIYKD